MKISIIWPAALLSILTLISSVHAGVVPPRYRDVRLFRDPGGKGDQPYDPCFRYNKSLQYTASGVMNVMLGTTGYSFQLNTLAAEAASVWNAKITSNGCSFTISDAKLSTPNFIINDKFGKADSGTLAITVPKGYESKIGLAAGIYLNNASPLTVGRELVGLFDSDMNGEQVAHALAMLTILHEFGHALGFAHPIEELDNPRDTMQPQYSPFSIEWTKQGAFDRSPIMIGNIITVVNTMYKVLNKRRLKFDDMQPSTPEVNTLKQILSCSAIQTTKSAKLDAQCSSFLAQGQKVLQYPILAWPYIFELRRN